MKESTARIGDTHSLTTGLEVNAFRAVGRKSNISCPAYVYIYSDSSSKINYFFRVYFYEKKLVESMSMNDNITNRNKNNQTSGQMGLFSNTSIIPIIEKTANKKKP